jgi:glycine C-acetyltransferase
MVIYPIAKGMIILRLIPTAAHSIEDVNETIAAFEIKSKLLVLEYKNAGTCTAAFEVTKIPQLLHRVF